MIEGLRAALQRSHVCHGLRGSLRSAPTGNPSHRSASTLAPSQITSQFNSPSVPNPSKDQKGYVPAWGSYWDTSPPLPSQLREAELFFARAAPQLLYSSTDFRNVKISPTPEVAFLGRSNVGKSSLLNAVMGQKICHTSSKPGRTRTMNFFSVGGEDGAGNPGKLTLLDMPGYGSGSRAEWGGEIIKYLVGRRQYVRIIHFHYSEDLINDRR